MFLPEAKPTGLYKYFGRRRPERARRCDSHSVYDIKTNNNLPAVWAVLSVFVCVLDLGMEDFCQAADVNFGKMTTY